MHIPFKGVGASDFDTPSVSESQPDTTYDQAIVNIIAAAEISDAKVNDAAKQILQRIFESGRFDDIAETAQWGKLAADQAAHFARHAQEYEAELIAMIAEEKRVAEHDFPPKLDDLMSVKAQLWHNDPSAKGKVAEWTLKLRCGRYSDHTKQDEYFVGFLPSPRKARETANRYVKDGKFSNEWALQFEEMSRELNTSTLIGFMTKPKYRYKKIKAGDSSNARDAYDRFWATLSLDLAGTRPDTLTLFFGSDEPVVIKLTASGVRTPDACGWFGAYDPQGLIAAGMEKKRLARQAQALSQQQRHNPVGVVTGIVEEYCRDIRVEINLLQDDNERLKSEFELADRFLKQAWSLIGDLADQNRDLKDRLDHIERFLEQAQVPRTA